jgi:bacillithiol biosynthesis deacetylase BshB2
MTQSHKQILVVLPHPDDEAFGASGSLAIHVYNGAKVTYACLTLGQMGRNMGVPPFANRVTLPAIRLEELKASCKAIGIEDLRLLGFHDKMIEFEEPQLLDGKINELIQELRPSLIITFYPGYSVHPDHDATGAAVVRVVAAMPKEERPIVQCLAFAKNTVEDIGRPDIIVDVRGFLKNKLDSIRAHRSQFQAPELMGKNNLSDKELEDRFGMERFWTYRFND